MAKFFLVLLVSFVLLIELTSIDGKKKPKPGKPNNQKPKPTRPPMGGGLGPLKPADNKVNQLVSILEGRIQDRICDIMQGKCKRLGPIKAQAYREQIVAGTNYFVAVSAESQLFHVKIFEQPWNNTIALVDIRGPKGLNEDINYF